MEYTHAFYHWRDIWFCHRRAKKLHFLIGGGGLFHAFLVQSTIYLARASPFSCGFFLLQSSKTQKELLLSLLSQEGNGTQTTNAKLYYFMHEIDYQNWHWVLFPFPLDFPFIRIIRLQILNLWLLFGKMHFLAAKAILIKEPYHTNPSLSFLLQCRCKLASQTKMHLVNFVGHPNFLMWHIQICSSFHNV